MTRRPLAASWRTALAATLSAAALSGPAIGQDAAQAGIDAYHEQAQRLIDAARAEPLAWPRLAELTDTFGPRLSGSAALEGAIAWVLERMRADGLEDVRAEPVMVPHWVRGEERLDLLAPGERPLPVLGLGGSVGTPSDGIAAEALVVSSFDDLAARAAEARGRIVVFDVPFTSYGETVQYRGRGPSRAAAVGAVAVLVRSVGPMGLRTPHTGGFTYDAAAPRIPAAAIAAEDAAMLHRLQDRGVRPALRLRMGARFLPEAESANVVGELRGRERPDEVVVVGCHLDSWDVGTGASDDGAGCVVVWEAVRLMRKTGLRPRRTVRVVLFTNEENGLRGGLGYRDRHAAALPNHVMMLEADLGFFPPLTFGFSGSAAARDTVTGIASLTAGLDTNRVAASGEGADIGPAVRAGGIPSMSFNGDAGQYFVIHHTPADTIERIAPDDLTRGAAAVAVMAYVVADLPARIR
jgi:carboxypeptidase Q